MKETKEIKPVVRFVVIVLFSSLLGVMLGKAFVCAAITAQKIEAQQNATKLRGCDK